MGGWIEIQQRTFTNWVNENLKERSMKISDLVADFNTGTNLIALVEILMTGYHKKEKKVGKFTKEPKIFAQKLENVSKALKAITDDGVKLVNIGNEDIVNGNQKLILGLIWTLIAKYQISLGKNELLDWVNKKLRSVGHPGVSNFNKDWNSGVAVSALCDACGGGLPTWSSMDGGKKEANCNTGIDTAKNNLKIPNILDGSDMSNPEIDELSMMTYVAYFKTAQPGSAKPTVKAAPIVAANCKASGPGVSPNGVPVGEPANFSVAQTQPHGGDLTVTVDGPKDPCEARVNPQKDGEWTVVYRPKLPGVYMVNVKLNGDHVPGSPFKVTIAGPKATASGAGLEGGMANAKAPFVVKTDPPSDLDLVVTVDGPSGDTATPNVKKNADGTYNCDYLPKKTGVYTVSALLGGAHVTGSPWKVTIGGPKLTASGPGISAAKVHEPAPFSVKADPPSDEKLVVTVSGPMDGNPNVKQNPDKSWTCDWTPNDPGTYVVTAKVGDQHVQGSPWTINVAAAAQKKRSGPSLGYENKIVGFYSTTTSSQQVRQDTQELQTLLQNKGVHKKASFTPWTPVDVEMEKEFRDKIWEKAGNRKLPMLFVDDEYIGSYAEVLQLEEEGKLQAILDAMP